MPRTPLPVLTPQQRLRLRSSYRGLPAPRANDGVVPTRSQVWGDVIHAAEADHLDVIGHFGAPQESPPHFDWLTTGSGFTRQKFEAVWAGVVDYIAAGRAMADSPER
jgi:hypothetical protein